MIHLSLSSVAILPATPILFIAGMTKGAFGVGLPIVAVPLLRIFIALPTAAALLLPDESRPLRNIT
jgi:uncharacterized membrane protein YfcA